MLDLWFTDGTSLKQLITGMKVDGAMLYLDIVPICETEKSNTRSVTVTATRTMMYPVSRIIRGQVTVNEITTREV